MKFTQYCIALFLLFSTLNLSAQPPKFQWGKRGGSGGQDFSNPYEHVIDMTTDPHGNVYVLATISNSLANVDGHSGNTVRDRLSLASWDCGGHFRWMKTYGSAGYFGGTAIGADTLGGIYMTGVTVSSNSLGYSYFDTDTTLGYTNRQMYIVKYDTSGQLKWLKMPDRDLPPVVGAQTTPIDISVAPNGDIYWLASLDTGSYDNNAYTITNYSFCVVRYNKNGVYQSIVPLDITTTDGGSPANLHGGYNVATSHLARDNNSGAFYLSGPFDPIFGTLKFGDSSITAAGGVIGYPFYITKFDASGNSLWTHQSAPDHYANTFTCRPVLDEQGNVYAAGGTDSSNTFLGYTFTTALGGMTPFVVSVSSSGTLNWGRTAKALLAGTKVCGLAYRNNILAATGPYGGRLVWDTDTLTAPVTMSGTTYVFLARLNAHSGAEISMDSIASEGTLNNEPTAMTSDRNGNFYVGGLFDNILYPGGDTITSAGGWYDWFVAKFGSANCNCTVPVVGFTNIASGNSVLFTASISTAADSITWDFGDGTHGTGNNPNHVYANGGNYTVCVTAYNSCGNNTNCQTISINGTRISNTPGFGQINVYPNPATQLLTIENAPPGTQLTVYDMAGRLVLQQQLKSREELIDVSFLTPGMYLVRMTNNEGKQLQTKFMKQ